MNKAKKARDDGDKLLNENGIKTKAQDPAYLFDYPWLEFDKKSTDRKNAVSSIMVNDYSKAVLIELKKRTELSDRKRIIMIVEAGLRAMAEDIEKGQN